VPESRIRRKAAYTSPPKASGGPKVNPPWFVPVMVGLMILGLAWIVVFYLTQGQYPVPTVPLGDGKEWTPGNWNLVAGFAFVLAGFVMTTRWH
jgi:Cell division protein CrgA